MTFLILKWHTNLYMNTIWIVSKHLFQLLLTNLYKLCLFTINSDRSISLNILKLTNLSIILEIYHLKKYLNISQIGPFSHRISLMEKSWSGQDAVSKTTLSTLSWDSVKKIVWLRDGFWKEILRLLNLWFALSNAYLIYILNELIIHAHFISLLYIGMPYSG